MTASYNRPDLSAEAEKVWQSAHHELDPDHGKPMPKATLNHDYDKTPAQQAAEQFRADLRADLAEIMDELHSQRARLDNLGADLEAIRAGLTQAASQPAPANADGENFTAVRIVREMRKKKYYYKMQGGRDVKFGVTVWDEVLEALDLDKVEYDENDIHKLNPPIEVHVFWEWYTDDNGELKKRRKVTGRA